MAGPWPEPRKWVQASLVAAVGLAVAGCAIDRSVAAGSGPPSSLEVRLARAQRLLEQGRRDKASGPLRDVARELEAVLRRQPRSAEHLFWLGTALHLLGDASGAARAFEAAADLEPTQVAASYNLGQLHQLRREHEAALRWYQRAERASPGDWRTKAKLVQVLQALGRTAERDRARMALLSLHRSRKTRAAEYCREQLQDGRYSILAFERFELAGEWGLRYRFEITDAASSSVRSVALGSYRVTTALGRLHGALRDGEPLFHLDGYGPGVEHETFAFYAREPGYEEVRGRVLEILRGSRQPISGTIASPALANRAARAAPFDLRIQNAELVIASSPERDFVTTTFSELQRLAPSVAIDPVNRIFVTGPVHQEDVGTVLVAELASSGRRVTIAYTSSSNKAVAAIPRDAANGKGTDAYVYFNHQSDPAIPTMTPDGRVVAQRGRPAFIGLGHELIHALHFITGTSARVLDGDGSLRELMGQHSFRDEGGAEVTVTEDAEELDTIGLGGRRNGPTENELRWLNRLPSRGAYGLESRGEE